MNKILAPLNNRNYIQELVEAGVDEFYMGFYDPEWEEEFGDFAEINRMSGFKRYANPYNFEEVLDIIPEIKKYGKSIFITINTASYKEPYFKKLEQYFIRLKEVGADGVIVSTPELVMLAKKVGIEPVASTMCGIFNSDLVDFYRSIGMKRMILPRDLSLDEIEHIVKANPDIFFEVFLMRNGCQFSDSHCLGFHKERGSVCGNLNNSSKSISCIKKGFKTQHDVELNDMLYVKFFHRMGACGLCALYRFVKMGIGSYKIVGRSERPDGIIEDTKMIIENIKIIESCNSEKEFLEKMKFPKDSRVECKMGFSCYYPEVRFDDEE